MGIRRSLVYYNERFGSVGDTSRAVVPLAAVLVLSSAHTLCWALSTNNIVYALTCLLLTWLGLTASVTSKSVRLRLLGEFVCLFKYINVIMVKQSVPCFVFLSFNSMLHTVFFFYCWCVYKLNFTSTWYWDLEQQFVGHTKSCSARDTIPRHVSQ